MNTQRRRMPARIAKASATLLFLTVIAAFFGAAQADDVLERMGHKRDKSAPLPVVKNQDGTYDFLQDNCEFTLNFPSEPYQAQRCAPDNPQNCNMATSFTKVFDMVATVNVIASCQAVAPEMAVRYSPDIMKMTLTALALRHRLQNYEIGTQDVGGARQAVLLGQGQSGSNETVYIAQLWVGQNSVLTTEMELVGTPIDVADTMFSTILDSIGPTAVKHAEKDAEAQDKNKDDKDAD